MKALTVRSQIVKQIMSNLYIDSNWDELCKMSSVVKLLTTRGGSLRDQFGEHIEGRVDEHYPASANGGDLSSSNVVPKPSGEFGPGINKQAIEAEAPSSSLQTFFYGVRLMIVTQDSEAADAHAPDTMAQ